MPFHPSSAPANSYASKPADNSRRGASCPLYFASKLLLSKLI